MKIQRIQLQNFKRFTDLTIENIPLDTKLILLIGSNGSGKSTIFDAFDFVMKGRFATYSSTWEQYYKKADNDTNIVILLENGEELKRINADRTIGDSEYKKKFFGRSSLRIIPQITNSGGGGNLIENDSDRPVNYIEKDDRFINDISVYIAEIDRALREPVFSGRSADTLKIFRDYIEPFNTSLLNIFEGDEKTTIQIAEYQNATSIEPPKLIFTKGKSKINYDLLSHGEKQVIILLLNFIVRKKYYEDAIIFIDEMDCHLNTAIQYNLIKEITEVWIPDTSQLWTASHALGFIDYARKAANAQIIDFDLLDFDLPQTLLPQPKESLEVYDIAIPKNVLFSLLGKKRLVVCENKNDEYYNLLNIENTIFVGVKDSRAVFLEIKTDSRYHSIRDRDFLSDSEIERISRKYPHHHILRYYDFENYIYHPDNISELNPIGFNKNDYMNEILKQKQSKIIYILPNIISSRQNYEEFKTQDSLKDKDVNSIVEDLNSNEFERFYKFFDMKDQFNKIMIAGLNLSREKLVSTNWFKSKIENLLNN